MVAVNETDRDALGFLWVEDSSDCDNPSIIILRFARVVFGVRIEEDGTSFNTSLAL